MRLPGFEVAFDAGIAVVPIDPEKADLLLPVGRNEFAAEIDQPHHVVARSVDHRLVERAPVRRTVSPAHDASELLMGVDGEDRRAMTVERATSQRHSGSATIGTDLEDTGALHTLGQIVKEAAFFEADGPLGHVEILNKGLPDRDAIKGAVSTFFQLVTERAKNFVGNAAHIASVQFVGRSDQDCRLQRVHPNTAMKWLYAVERLALRAVAP